MTLLPGGRDQQISDEMIDEIHRRWRHWATAPSRTMIRDALTAALALLPDEAAIRADERAKIAASWNAHWNNFSDKKPGRNWHSGCNGCLDFGAALAARGSATEETR